MSWDELLNAARTVQASAIEREPSLASHRIQGIGWATVDADRAQSEFDLLLGGGAESSPATSWQALERDPALGARAWLRHAEPGRADDPALILLEPETEGRLAASLVRFGEGVAVIYLGEGGAARANSFVRGRFVPGGAAWGPHVVVLGDTLDD